MVILYLNGRENEEWPMETSPRCRDKYESMYAIGMHQSFQAYDDFKKQVVTRSL